MMEVGVVSLEWIFFHHKYSPQSHPYCIKNHQGQSDNQGPYFRSPDYGQIGQAKSKKHNAHISQEPQRFIFYHCGDEAQTKQDKRHILDKQKCSHIGVSKIGIMSKDYKLNQ